MKVSKECLFNISILSNTGHKDTSGGGFWQTPEGGGLCHWFLQCQIIPLFLPSYAVPLGLPWHSSLLGPPESLSSGLSKWWSPVVHRAHQFRHRHGLKLGCRPGWWSCCVVKFNKSRPGAYIHPFYSTFSHALSGNCEPSERRGRMADHTEFGVPGLLSQLSCAALIITWTAEVSCRWKSMVLHINSFANLAVPAWLWHVQHALRSH